MVPILAAHKNPRLEIEGRALAMMLKGDSQLLVWSELIYATSLMYVMFFTATLTIECDDRPVYSSFAYLLFRLFPLSPNSCFA
jgi:hypothetical protein